MKKDQEIIKLYNEQYTGTEISKLLNIGRRTVYRALTRNNVTLHSNNAHFNCRICGVEVSRRHICGTCNTNLRRYRVKLKAVEYKGGCCEKCGWSGDISGYDCHHIDPATKSFNLTAVNMANKAWAEVKKELDKCLLLCALCHRLEHSDYNNPEFQKIASEHLGKLFK